jgi:hypothetical protein
VPPRTIDDVQDSLDQAFGWRRTELLALKTAILEAEHKSPQSPLTRALARAGVALLYAHWEGYAKEACQCYVDYVAIRRLRHDELNDGFLQTSLMALGRRVTTGDEGGRSALLDAVRRPQASRASIPRKTIVDTKSNLRYSVLCEIFEAVGFPTDKFTLRDKLIDRSLCDSRNSIAHGRDHYPSTGSFSALHDDVIDMMGDIRDLILASVRQQLYRRQ